MRSGSGRRNPCVQRMLAHDLLSQQYRKAGYLPPPFSWPCAQDQCCWRCTARRPLPRDDPSTARPQGCLVDHRYGPVAEPVPRRWSCPVRVNPLRHRFMPWSLQVLGKLLETGCAGPSASSGPRMCLLKRNATRVTVRSIAGPGVQKSSAAKPPSESVLRLSCCICRRAPAQPPHC